MPARSQEEGSSNWQYLYDSDATEKSYFQARSSSLPMLMYSDNIEATLLSSLLRQSLNCLLEDFRKLAFSPYHHKKLI